MHRTQQVQKRKPDPQDMTIESLDAEYANLSHLARSDKEMTFRQIRRLKSITAEVDYRQHQALYEAVLSIVLECMEYEKGRIRQRSTIHTLPFSAIMSAHCAEGQCPSFSADNHAHLRQLVQGAFKRYLARKRLARVDFNESALVIVLK